MASEVKQYTLQVVNDEDGMHLTINGTPVPCDLESFEVVCSRGGFRTAFAEFTQALKEKAKQSLGALRDGQYL